MKPHGARILIDRIPAEPVKGSLIEVVTLTEQPSQFARVVAVGPGPRLADGTRRPLEVKTGDKVVTVQFCGTPIQSNEVGKDLFLVDEGDILAIIS